MVQLSVQASHRYGQVNPLFGMLALLLLYVCWTVLHKSWRVAQVLRFGQSVGGLVEHKEFVLSSRFANSKLLLLFLLPLPASTKHNSKRDAEQRRGKPSRRPCCSPWLGCKINCPQFSPPLAVWSIFSWVSSKMKSWEMDHWCSS